MRKPLRYALIFLALLASVCLAATAVGICVIEQGTIHTGWGTHVNLGGRPLYVSIYSKTEISYGLSEVTLPVSWLCCVLTITVVPALLCIAAASVLIWPLFRPSDAPPARPGAE